jgi:hypothetical protein
MARKGQETVQGYWANPHQRTRICALIDVLLFHCALYLRQMEHNAPDQEGPK